MNIENGTKAYVQLEEAFRKMNHLQHLVSIAGWDEAVMMPPASGDARGDALASCRQMMSEMMHHPGLPTLFEHAIMAPISQWQTANLREMHRVWKQTTSVSPDLVAASSRASSRCEQAWRSLRAQNDWKSLEPLLTEVIALAREEAVQRSEATGLSPYDAMISVYEPGQNTESLSIVFGQLKAFLPSFIQQVVEHQKKNPAPSIKGDFPISHQEALGREVMQAVGFDFSRGRLDVSHHPFCGGVPQDVRITTRYRQEEFVESLMGVIHETGHARYEQSLPRNWIDQPVGHARSMGVHESQSLLFEMQMGRSREFLSFVLPLVKKHFAMPVAWDIDGLYRAITRVQPGFIRVTADEVTYPLHVINRFELEQELISGRLEVADLPEAWNAKMVKSLGLSTLGNDKDGCMQDVHWMAGIFGYFPSYTLGALLAAQLFDKAKAEHPSMPAEIARGDFTRVNAWLDNKVWSQASLHRTPELIELATGEALSSRAFIEFLKRRYLPGS